MMKAAEKKAVWRYIAFALGIACIVLLWAGKTTAGRFADMSPTQALPMILVNVTVTTVKVAAITGALRLFRWCAEKIRK